MSKVETTKRMERGIDRESQLGIYDGLNMTQLAEAFRLDIRTIRRKLRHVEPCGVRNGSHYWGLWKAAPHLVKPTQDIESYIKNMHYSELPKHLSKEFWAGQRARQAYLQAEGDLWPTTEVVSKVGELMKLMSMALKLLGDTVDRQSELSEKQRQVIHAVVDATQTDLVRAIKENFTPKKKKPVEQSVVDPLNEVDDEENDAL